MVEGFSIEGFVRDWGYLAVLIGSIFEGEVILITASAYAACEILSITKVFTVALATTIVVDQVLYWVGYTVGTDWIIKKIPRLEESRKRVFTLLKKMDILFIFAFRFIYGIRTVSPIIIGAARVRPIKFMIFNIFSGICWASVSCFVGYTMADVVIDGKIDIRLVPLFVLLTLAVLYIPCVIVWKKHKRK
ncbi:MAG: DedA family protein [Holosporales bacterium]|jgi:membrane protein DedA with SNARE-associated domain|nr:DedA family protein [Holosporales bacterium]